MAQPQRTPSGVQAERRLQRGMTRRNVVVGSVVRVLSLVMLVLTPAVAARTLTPAGVAQVMIAVSVITVIGIVGQMGVPWVVSWRIAQLRAGAIDAELVRGTLRSATLFLLALTAVLTLAVAVPWGVPGDWLVQGATRGLLVAVALAGAGRAASKIYSEASKGFGDVNVAALGSDLLGPSIGLAAAVVAIATLGTTTSVSFVSALSLGWLVAACFAFWRAPVKPSLRRYGHRETEHPLRNGMAVLGLISILNVGIQQAHIIISGYTLDLSDAGVFSTAARLASLTGAPLMIISALASPDVGVALQTKEPNRLAIVERRLQALTGLFFVLASALGLIYIVFGSSVLRLMFGPAYVDGHGELIVLSAGPLGSLFAGVAGLSLMLAGERRVLLRDTVVGSCVALIGMLVGVSTFGSMGLAFGYSFGQLAINALLLRSCHRELGLTPIANPLAMRRRAG